MVDASRLPEMEEPARCTYLNTKSRGRNPETKLFILKIFPFLNFVYFLKVIHLDIFLLFPFDTHGHQSIELERCDRDIGCSIGA